MAIPDADLQRLIAQLPRKESRAHRLYWLYTIVAVALTVVWLVYAFTKVGQLQNERQELATQVKTQQGELDRIASDLKAKNSELETVAQDLRIPLEELQNLKSFGFLSGTENVPDLHTYVQESNKAKDELKLIKSTNAEFARRKNIKIRYYVRETDAGRVTQAMESLKTDYGFDAQSPDRSKEPHTYTNAIWIVKNKATAEDVKLVAFYLILRGIQVRYIGPPTSTPQRVSSGDESIWVVAEPKADQKTPCTVDAVKRLTPASFASVDGGMKNCEP